MLVLGISSFYHDSGAALVKDGKILSAVQEERFTRIKHDNSFPYNSINHCLKENKLKIEDIDEIVFYENPKLKMDRILKTFISDAPRNFGLFSKAFSSQYKKWKYQDRR